MRQASLAWGIVIVVSVVAGTSIAAADTTDTTTSDIVIDQNTDVDGAVIPPGTQCIVTTTDSLGAEDRPCEEIDVTGWTQALTLAPDFASSSVWCVSLDNAGGAMLGSCTPISTSELDALFDANPPTVDCSCGTQEPLAGTTVDLRLTNTPADHATRGDIEMELVITDANGVELARTSNVTDTLTIQVPSGDNQQIRAVVFAGPPADPQVIEREIWMRGTSTLAPVGQPSFDDDGGPAVAADGPTAASAPALPPITDETLTSTDTDQLQQADGASAVQGADVDGEPDLQQPSNSSTATLVPVLDPVVLRNEAETDGLAERLLNDLHSNGLLSDDDLERLRNDGTFMTQLQDALEAGVGEVDVSGIRVIIGNGGPINVDRRGESGLLVLLGDFSGGKVSLGGTDTDVDIVRMWGDSENVNYGIDGGHVGLTVFDGVTESDIRFEVARDGSADVHFHEGSDVDIDLRLNDGGNTLLLEGEFSVTGFGGRGTDDVTVTGSGDLDFDRRDEPPLVKVWRRDDDADFLGNATFEGTEGPPLGISPQELIGLLVQDGYLSRDEAAEMLTDVAFMTELTEQLANGGGLLTFIPSGTRRLQQLLSNSKEWAIETLQRIGGIDEALTERELTAAWLLERDALGMLELLTAFVGKNGGRRLVWAPPLIETYVGPSADRWDYYNGEDDFFEHRDDEGWLYVDFVDEWEFEQFLLYGMAGVAGGSQVRNPNGTLQKITEDPAKEAAYNAWRALRYQDLVQGPDGRLWARVKVDEKSTVIDQDARFNFQWGYDEDDLSAVHETKQLLANFLYKAPPRGSNRVNEGYLLAFDNVDPETLIALGVLSPRIRSHRDYRDDRDFLRDLGYRDLRDYMTDEWRGYYDMPTLATHDHVRDLDDWESIAPRDPGYGYVKDQDRWRHEEVFESWNSLRNHARSHPLLPFEVFLEKLGHDQVLEGSTTFVFGEGELDYNGTHLGDDTVIVGPGVRGTIDFEVGDSTLLSLGGRDELDIDVRGGTFNYLLIGSEDFEVDLAAGGHTASEILVDANSRLDGTLSLGDLGNRILVGGDVDLRGRLGAGDDFFAGNGSGRVDLDFAGGDDTLLTGNPVVDANGNIVLDANGFPVFDGPGGIYDLSGTTFGEGDDTLIVAPGSEVTSTDQRIHLGNGDNTFAVLQDAKFWGDVIAGSGQDMAYLFGEFNDFTYDSGKSLFGTDSVVVGASARGELGVIDQHGSYYEVWRNRLNDNDAVVFVGPDWEIDEGPDGRMTLIQRDADGNVITETVLEGEIERVIVDGETVRNIPPELRTRGNLLGYIGSAISMIGMGVAIVVSGGAATPFLVAGGTFQLGHMIVNNAAPEQWIPAAFALIGSAVGGVNGKAMEFFAGTITAIENEDPVLFLRSAAAALTTDETGKTGDIGALLIDNLDEIADIVSADSAGDIIEGILRVGANVGANLGGGIIGEEQTRAINLFADGIALATDFNASNKSIFDLTQLIIGAGYTLSRSLDGTRPSGVSADNDPQNKLADTNPQLPAGYTFQSPRSFALDLVLESVDLLDDLFDHDENADWSRVLSDTLDNLANIAETTHIGEYTTGDVYLQDVDDRVTHKQKLDTVDGVANDLPTQIRAVSDAVTLLGATFNIEDIARNVAVKTEFNRAANTLSGILEKREQGNIAVGRSQLTGQLVFLQRTEVKDLEGKLIPVTRAYNLDGTLIGEDYDDEPSPVAGVKLPNFGGREAALTDDGRLVALDDDGNIVQTFEPVSWGENNSIVSWMPVDNNPDDVVVRRLGPDGTALLPTIVPGTDIDLADYVRDTNPIPIETLDVGDVRTFDGIDVSRTSSFTVGDADVTVLSNPTVPPDTQVPSTIETRTGVPIGGVDANSPTHEYVVHVDGELPPPTLAVREGKPVLIEFGVNDADQAVMTISEQNTVVNGTERLSAEQTVAYIEASVDRLIAIDSTGGLTRDQLLVIEAQRISNVQVSQKTSLEWVVGGVVPYQLVSLPDGVDRLPIDALRGNDQSGLGYIGGFGGNYVINDDGANVIVSSLDPEVTGHDGEYLRVYQGIKTNIAGDFVEIDERLAGTGIKAVLYLDPLKPSLGDGDAITEIVGGAQAIGYNGPGDKDIATTPFTDEVATALNSSLDGEDVAPFQVLGFSDGSLQTLLALEKAVAEALADGHSRAAVQAAVDRTFEFMFIGSPIPGTPNNAILPTNTVFITLADDPVSVIPTNRSPVNRVVVHPEDHGNRVATNPNAAPGTPFFGGDVAPPHSIERYAEILPAEIFAEGGVAAVNEHFGLTGDYGGTVYIQEANLDSGIVDTRWIHGPDGSTEDRPTIDPRTSTPSDTESTTASAGSDLIDQLAEQDANQGVLVASAGDTLPLQGVAPGGDNVEGGPSLKDLLGGVVDRGSPADGSPDSPTVETLERSPQDTLIELNRHDPFWSPQVNGAGNGADIVLNSWRHPVTTPDQLSSNAYYFDEIVELSDGTVLQAVKDGGELGWVVHRGEFAPSTFSAIEHADATVHSFPVDFDNGSLDFGGGDFELPADTVSDEVSDYVIRNSAPGQQIQSYMFSAEVAGHFDRPPPGEGDLSHKLLIEATSQLSDFEVEIILNQFDGEPYSEAARSAIQRSRQ